jgi:hypothetical protein
MVASVLPPSPATIFFVSTKSLVLVSIEELELLKSKELDSLDLSFNLLKGSISSFVPACVRVAFLALVAASSWVLDAATIPYFFLYNLH